MSEDLPLFEFLRSISKNRASLLDFPGVDAKRTRPRPKSRRRLRKGGLKNFVELPLDVIYEIVVYLELKDLLNLSRLSKDFRAIFMSRATARNIWIRVFRGLKGLPPCPDDLSEPQYASLLFEKFCMGCGISPSNRFLDLNFRLRLCKKCYGANIDKGTNIEFDIPYKDIEPELFSLVPSQEISGAVHDPARRNSEGMSYLVPEVKAMYSTLCKFQDQIKQDPGAYRACIAELKLKVTKMMDDGRAIRQWLLGIENEARMNENKVIRERKDMIMERLQLLGWYPYDYPHTPQDDLETVRIWEAYLKKPQRLTARGWKKLEPILLHMCLSVQRERRIEDFCRTLFGHYHSKYVLKIPPESWFRRPTWKHIRDSDKFAQYRLQGYEMERNLSEFDHFFDEIVAENDARLENMAITVGKDLRKFIGCPTVKNLDPVLVLDLAASVVFCQSISWPEGIREAQWVVKPFYDAIMQRDPNSFLPDYPTCYSVYPSVDRTLVGIAMDVLEALGMSRTATREEVLSLTPTRAFECRCGHYKYSGSLSFEELVTHIYEQREWRLKINCFAIKPNLADALRANLVIDTHSLQDLRDLVGVAEFSVDEYKSLCRFPLTASDAATARKNFPINTNTCRICVELCCHLAPTMREPREYHMLTKHGRKMQEDDFSSSFR